MAGAAIVAVLMLLTGCSPARLPQPTPVTSHDAVAPESTACEAFGCMS
jgi:hypothetical protein